MKKILKTFIILTLFFSSTEVYAAGNLEVSGWIPYWRKATGTTETINHISTFTEINPFGYSVKNDGTLADTMDISNDPWPSLKEAAKNNSVKIIPSIMWSDGNAIDAVLRDTKKQATHINSIVEMVTKNNFDGVDIDYEGKKAETKEYFSTFLKNLKKALGKKILSCTIEARTPSTTSSNANSQNKYANDYKAINKYCDEVKIMTYDQGRIDPKLDKSNKGIYMPVADVKWVEKVIKLAAQDISKSKISIGVATYGYEYTIKETSKNVYSYDRLTSFNPKYATDIATQYKITPKRNGAGELSFTYTATSTTNATTTNLLWWSDASAIKDKMSLAKKLGVKGISIFKIDGGADQNIWNILKNN